MIHAFSSVTKVPLILLGGAADTMLEALAKEGLRGKAEMNLPALPIAAIGTCSDRL